MCMCLVFIPQPACSSDYVASLNKHCRWNKCKFIFGVDYAFIM